MYLAMTLSEYLDATKTSRAAFAEKIGVTPVALYRYMAGSRQPRRAVIDQIIRATDGKVQAGDLYVPHQVAAA
jgi:transcriptional regulator with XRE-family HTH domain